MKEGIIAMKSTPYRVRNNEVYGDMSAWIAAHAGDNESDLARLKRNLRLAREEEIAAAIGRDKSTVSRTLSRARRRLYKCLRYGL